MGGWGCCGTLYTASCKLHCDDDDDAMMKNEKCELLLLLLLVECHVVAVDIWMQCSAVQGVHNE